MEIVKRGYEPKDAIEFGSKAAEKLNAAGQELVFLLNRGYDVKSASTFIGNHHLLSERQRLALARITSTKAALMERRRKELTQAPAELVFDGFNTIITMEVALSGSLLLAGMDGTIRDLAGLRGTYRIVDKTVRAVELLVRSLGRNRGEKGPVLPGSAGIQLRTPSDAAAGSGKGSCGGGPGGTAPQCGRSALPHGTGGHSGRHYFG